MSYTALYRKFRPAAFEEVKGQEHIVTTLKNQIRSGRIGHAYLFCGTRGTGKTTVAKILAKAVNCEAPADGSPCGTCAACRAINAGNSTNVIEIDAASNNSVDNVRQIREEVAYRPAEGKYKVYIIDEVHMLSTGAFNALLKTLEEPPEYVIFILATTEASKIPVTILSRCQRYDFRRMSVDTIAFRVKELLDREGVQAEEKGVRYLARMADGSMRDALSLLDECISCYMNEELTYDKILSVLGTSDSEQFTEILTCIAKNDVAGCIRCLDGFVQEGQEMTHFAGEFTWYLRNLLLIKNTDGLEDILDMSTESLARLKEVGKGLDDDALMRYIRICSELTAQLRNVTQKRIYVELALIRMCRPQMETDSASLRQRIAALEEKLENLQFAPAPMIAAPAEAARVQKKELPKREIKKAAPQELVEICRRWPEIRAAVSSKLLRAYLDRVELNYDADTGESRLFLIVGNNVDADFFSNHAEAKAELLEAIAKVADRTVDIELVKPDNRTDRNLAGVPLTEKIREVVDMPVELE